MLTHVALNILSFPYLPDTEFARWLTTEKGVMVIPVSAVMPDDRQDGQGRFCFAKNEATLAATGARLKAV
jgi:methionine aminotransferase